MTTRRSFIKSVSAISAGVTATGISPLIAGVPEYTPPGLSERKIYVFSKHLQWLDYEDMAKTAAKIGFDGIDLTVRPKGHVLPEKVKQDLPKAIRAMKDNGQLADRMTTAITRADDPLTQDILEAAAKAGIKIYRLGWFAYDASLSILENLEACGEELNKLAVLNKKYGLKAAYQNHVGEMVGGPVWDIAKMLEGVDEESIGVRYDVRHATAEGGLSWPVGLKYLSDRINSFDVKDFVWKEVDGKWQPSNVQIGDGMVDFERYMQIIKEYHIKGNFTIHLEYPIGGAEHGATKLDGDPDVVSSAMKHDLSKLRNLISQ